MSVSRTGYSTALQGAGGGIQTFTISRSVAAGDLVVVFTWSNTESPASATVTDGQSNTYTAISAAGTTGLNENNRMWYTRAASAGTLVVTIDKGSSAYGMYAVVANYAGVLASGTLLDVSGTTTSASTLSLTTTVANGVIVAMCSSNGGTPLAGSGYTLIASPNYAYYESCEDNAAPGATGAKTVAFDRTCQRIIAAAFKPLAGGGSNPPTITSIDVADGFQNSTQHVVITGTYLTAGTLTISGTNVTIANPVITGSTTFDADLVIATGASATARTLTITTADAPAATTTFTVRTRAGGGAAAVSTGPVGKGAHWLQSMRRSN